STFKQMERIVYMDERPSCAVVMVTMHSTSQKKEMHGLTITGDGNGSRNDFGERLRTPGISFGERLSDDAMTESA
ncbi:hypothetical protein MTO96_039770, partial [Rhipicephalus appendiculatus]